MLKKDKLTDAYKKLKPRISSLSATTKSQLKPIATDAYSKVKTAYPKATAAIAKLPYTGGKPKLKTLPYTGGKPTMKKLPYISEPPLKKMVKKRLARLKPKG